MKTLRTMMLAATAVLATTANAMPIDFTESGDILDFERLGDADIGLNVASGSLFEIDDDVLIFTLSAGMQIDSIALIISDHRDGGPNPTSVLYAVTGPMGELLGLDFIDDDSTNAVLSSPFDVAGDYQLRLSHSGGVPNAFSNWRWELAVSAANAVPEPTSLALLGVGMLIALRIAPRGARRTRGQARVA